MTRPPVGHLNLQDAPRPVKGQGEVGRKVQADQRAARGRQVTISAEAGTKGRHILLCIHNYSAIRAEAGTEGFSTYTPT